MLQPAIFALVCVIFRVTFSEVAPPVHPKSDADHMVLPIEDSCFQNPVLAKDDKALAPNGSLVVCSNDSEDFTIEAQVTRQRHLSQTLLFLPQK